MKDTGADVPTWAPPRDNRRSKLSRQAIVAAAIGVADSEGLAAVSIRRVAAELDARTMSLYTYIDGKEDLLNLMHDQVAGEVLIGEDLPADWRQAISEIAQRERALSRRHPWMIELIGYRKREVGPNGLRHAEETLAALSGLGLDLEAVWQVAMAIDELVMGCVIREGMEATTPNWRRPHLLEQPYVRSLLDTGAFPHISRALKGPIPTAEDNFERGLGWLLDGIEAYYKR